MRLLFATSFNSLFTFNGKVHPTSLAYENIWGARE
jgi:hypothetical protein